MRRTTRLPRLISMSTPAASRSWKRSVARALRLPPNSGCVSPAWRTKPQALNRSNVRSGRNRLATRRSAIRRRSVLPFGARVVNSAT
jgi:hypothetical protein